METYIRAAVESILSNTNREKLGNINYISVSAKWRWDPPKTCSGQLQANFERDNNTGGNTDATGRYTKK